VIKEHAVDGEKDLYTLRACARMVHHACCLMMNAQVSTEGGAVYYWDFSHTDISRGKWGRWPDGDYCGLLLNGGAFLPFSTAGDLEGA
jgi:hypothetical protein